MDVVRTPDARFELGVIAREMPWAPRTVDVPSGDGGTLRMAWVEAGPADGPVVLLLHGEPSWSFLWRKVMRVLEARGLRAIAPDLVGFGRSDKPTDQDAYTFASHLGWLGAFVDALGLRDIHLACQDWGGLLGLRMVGEQPARFSSVVAANTGLPTGDQALPPAFFAWQQFSQSVPELPVGQIVRSGCHRSVDDEVVAAYDAPFADERSKAGARKFPLLVPSRPDDPAAAPNRAAWAGLAAFPRPFLTAFSDQDPITRGGERVLQAKIAGAAGQPHVTLEGGGHFLQEDCGEALGLVIADAVDRADRR